MFRIIITLLISLLFMIPTQRAVSGVFTEIKKESREVKNDVGNAAGSIGSGIKRGVSTIGKSIKRNVQKTGKEIKEELD